MSIPADIAHLVIEAPDFVAPGFCDRIIARATAIGFEPATITSEHGTGIAPEIRNNERVIFDDPDLARTLWLRAASHFAQPFKGQRAVRLNERFRVYRYGPGQFFDWHQDGVFEDSAVRRSQFTMMIYLNDACEGGGTRFADIFSPHIFKDFTIVPGVGKALFFHHPLSHRGEEIVSGEKYVLRTDVMFEGLRT
ncbi:2-oxoglutarate-Fe(II)-dependent oxygenase superfamily protein [Litoreibacter ponti]|uniref:2-oxoglutarate-Fe(II)-dependent oxygenase superfamily protein n=1 Tax=Litoreibacter ponti TaxID=1510457 RepID=A0A2T6BD94_9RHOB|nr:2OG-Fe(II) oxygenase [Litoreibacter ponti]PTX54014.1 2-oxoglutarate-Fe(II)-dependent oxygenase superfamily protein [Litoreibacter ponti]